VPYDAQAGEAIVQAFAELAVYIKGPLAGQPAELRAFQAEWFRQIYGTLDEEGKRQFRTAFILQPKKVGKTYLAAFIALMMISLYGQYGGEVYSLANSRDQAAEVFKAARDMVAMSPGLQALGFWFDDDVRPSTKTITYRPLNAVYRALAAEQAALHGKGPYGLIVDELHAMRDREAIDAVREGMGIWPDPLTLYITNHGTLGESEPFWEEYDYAKRVLEEPDFDREYYAAINEAPDRLTDDELLEEGPHWYEIHPGLGDTVSVDFMRRACREAKEKPSQRAFVLQMHLGRPTQPVEAAIDMAHWRACASAEVTEKAFEGRRCAIGLDLSSRWDLTSATLVFPEDDGGRTWLSWSWIPRANATRIEELTKRPMRAWLDDPKVPLLSTQGNEIRFDEIESFLVELSARYDVAAVVYDPKFATQLAQNLDQAGLVMIEFLPSFKTYTEPVQNVESQINGHRLRHSGDKLLDYAASSLGIKNDQDWGSKPIKIDRRRSSKRIDPIVAGIMAEAYWVKAEPPVAPLSARDFAVG